MNKSSSAGVEIKTWIKKNSINSKSCFSLRILLFLIRRKSIYNTLSILISSWVRFRYCCKIMIWKWNKMNIFLFQQISYVVSVLVQNLNGNLIPIFTPRSTEKLLFNYGNPTITVFNKGIYFIYMCHRAYFHKITKINRQNFKWSVSTKTPNNNFSIFFFHLKKIATWDLENAVISVGIKKTSFIGLCTRIKQLNN